MRLGKIRISSRLVEKMEILELFNLIQQTGISPVSLSPVSELYDVYEIVFMKESLPIVVDEIPLFYVLAHSYETKPNTYELVEY